MTDENDGGPAFPVARYVNASGETHESRPQGMSLRDCFAGQALAGILSGPCSKDGVPLREWFDATVQAYALADAMLNVRSGLGETT